MIPNDKDVQFANELLYVLGCTFVVLSIAVVACLVWIVLPA
jgi:hypothetical protein